MKVKELAMIASLTTILIVVNVLLSKFQFLNITFLLILIYAKVIGLKRISFILFFFVTITNIILGFVLLHQLILMFLCLFLGPLLLSTIFRKITNQLIIAIIALILSIIYILVLDFSFWILFPTNLNGLYIYLTGGLIYAIPFFISTFLSVLLLYKPLLKVLYDLYQATMNEVTID